MKLISAAMGLCLALFIASTGHAQSDCRYGVEDDLFMKELFACDITELRLFSNRAHIRCKLDPRHDFPDNPKYPNWSQSFCTTGIYFFAVPLDGAGGFSGAFIATATAAIELKKPVLIGFKLKDASGAQYGCLETDCRKPLTMVLKP